MEKITKTKQSKNNIVDWPLVPFSCEKQRMKRSIKSTKHFEFDLYFDKENFCVWGLFFYTFFRQRGNPQSAFSQQLDIVHDKFIRHGILYNGKGLNKLIITPLFRRN